MTMQVPVQARSWSDYDPRTNTFLDTRTGQRVHPDGTPVLAGNDTLDLEAQGPRPIPGVNPPTGMPEPWLTSAPRRPFQTIQEALGRFNVGSEPFQALGREVEKETQTIAGLGTIGLRAVAPLNPFDYAPSKPGPGIPVMGLEAITGATGRARADPNASPKDILRKTGQNVYENEPMPFATGAIQALADPFNLLPGVGIPSVGKAAEALRVGGRAAERAAETAGGAALRALPVEKAFALTPDAEALLKKVDEGGVPSSVTATLRQIARENDVAFTAQSAPNDIIDGLRNKAASEAVAGKASALPGTGNFHYVNLTAPHDIQTIAATDNFKPLFDKRVEQGRMLGPFATREEAQAAQEVRPPAVPPGGVPPTAPAGVTPQGDLLLSFPKTMASSDEMTQLLNTIDRTYVGPRSTQKLVDDAKAALANEGDLSASASRLMGTENMRDYHVAQAEVLIPALMEKAKTAATPGLADLYRGNAADLARYTSMQLMESGRTIQAATIWNALGPDGIVHYAQKIITTALERKFNAVSPGAVQKSLQEADIVVKVAARKASDAELVEGVKNIRAYTAKAETTVRQAITDNVPAKTRDVLFYVRNLMAGEGGKVRLSRLDTTMPPDMIKELVAEAERVSALTGPERRAGQEALETRLKSLEFTRQESAAFTPVEKAVQAYNEKLAAQDAATAAHQKVLEAQAEVRRQEQAVKNAALEAKTAQGQAEGVLKVGIPAGRREAKAQSDAMMLARRDLVVAQKEVRVNELAAARAEKAAAKAEAGITYLTDAEARVAEKRIIAEGEAAITKLRSTVRVNGTEIPRDLAVSLMERAHALSSLNETDRWIASQTLLHDIQGLVSMTAAEKVLDLLNLPRTMLTMWDYSAPFRQGIVLAAGHPTDFARAFGPMFKASGDFKYARELDASFHTGPMADIFDRMKLYLAPLDYSGLSTLSRREEGYASHYAQLIPGAKRSEIAYVTFLNKFRSGVATSTIKGWEKAGYQYTDKDLQDFGQFINWATGRGSLPSQLNTVAPWLSAAFFAPRFMASRIELPFAGLRAGASLVGGAAGITSDALYSTMVAKQIGADVGKFVAAGIVPLMMIKAMEASGNKDVSVKTDPHSSEFGKGKIGGIRFDFWGGEQQIVRAFFQFRDEQRKSSTGTIKPISRADVFGTWLRSKASPLGGTAYDSIFQTGYQRSGYQSQSINQGTAIPGVPYNTGAGLATLGESGPEGLAKWKVWQALAPLTLQAALSSYNQAGLVGAGVTAVASGFGVGVQAYQTTRDLQDKASQAMYGMDYKDLETKFGSGPELRAVAEDPSVKKSIEDLQANQRYDEQEAIKYGFKSNDDYKAAQTKKFVAEYPTITDPKGKREYIQTFKEHIAVGADATLGELFKQEKPDPTDTLHALAKKYWSLEPKWQADGTESGHMDMKTWDKERQAVLAEAKQHGFDPKYIVERGQENYLTDYKDPVVNAALKEYAADQKTLRPYWEIRDTQEKNIPVVLWADGKDANASFREHEISFQRDKMFHNNKAIKEALIRWGHRQPDKFAPVATPVPTRSLPRGYLP